MIDELNKALDVYQKNWEAEKAQRTDQAFFSQLQPTAVGWKTVDDADFDTRFAELRGLADQIHMGWMNGRWIAVVHLREASLTWGIAVVKLMQRRPNSTDAAGLDHVDFLSPATAAVEDIETIVKREPNLKWTPEENGPCRWVSLWWDGSEAKLRTDTTVDVAIRELQEVTDHLKGKHD